MILRIHLFGPLIRISRQALLVAAFSIELREEGIATILFRERAAHLDCVFRPEVSLAPDLCYSVDNHINPDLPSVP